MTIEEIIHVFERSRLVTDCFKQEAVTEAYVEALAALRAQQAEQKNGTLKTTWETPDACPHCMEHLSREWSFCPECGQPTDWSKNPPLTLEELRELEGEPVWVANLRTKEKKRFKDEWALVNLYYGAAESTNTRYSLWNYGKTWLAYRRKEESK